jgi:hypothetical protein
MKQFLGYQWKFKCHICKDEYHDPVEIGMHFKHKHNYNLISDNELI